MSRSKWKIPVVDLRKRKSYKLKVWKRSNQLLFKNLDKVVMVHDGKILRKTRPEKEKVGFKFGFFSFTRKHTKKIVTKKPSKKNAKK
jgi:ribosomal protein S19